MKPSASSAPPEPLTFDERLLHEVRESRLLINRADDWLFAEFRPHVGRRILEIGCGLGNHIAHFLDRELLLGFDISDESIVQVRQRFASHPNVRIECRSITDPSVLELIPQQLDTALSENVFEHIEDDRLAFRHTFQLLQPGGKFIIIVPAHPQIYGPMDASIGHYRRYTKALLAERFQEAGFQVLAGKYINTLGALGWLVNGRLLRRQVPPRGQLKLLNRLIPFIRAFENVVPAPFGVSVLMVGQKPVSSS